MQEPENRDFEKIFKEHYKSLCDFAYNLLQDRDLAKDTVQEVFLKLWKNRDNLEMGTSIRSYLFKATSHTALNHLRFSKKIIRMDEEGFNAMSSPSGTEEIGFKELELKIRASIDRLPPKCKVIYLLSRHEGLKYQEIADTLDISLKTVENQMGIALEKLRNDLKPFLTPEFLSVMIFIGYLIYTYLK